MIQKEETTQERDMVPVSLVSPSTASLRHVDGTDCMAKNGRTVESNEYHGGQVGVQKAMALKQYMSRNVFAVVFVA